MLTPDKEMDSSNYDLNFPWVDLAGELREQGNLQLALIATIAELATEGIRGRVETGWSYLGILSCELGEWFVAELCFRRAKYFCRKDDLGRFYLAEAYFETGQIELCKKEIRAALRQGPPSWATEDTSVERQLVELMGLCYQKEGKVGLADRWFFRADDIPGESMLEPLHTEDELTEIEDPSKLTT